MVTRDVAHKAVFTNVLIKITLFGLCYPRLMRKADPTRVRGKKRSYEICKSVYDTSHFKRRETDEAFNILKGLFDCNSNQIIYSFECKQCQYCSPYESGTKTKLRYRINNYKSTHRKFRKKYVEKDLAILIKKRELKQKLFHGHCCSEDHQGIENWSVTLRLKIRLKI